VSKKLSEQLKYRLGSDDLDKVVALEAERDTLKELLKEGWRYKDDMLQWQEYRIWKKKVGEFFRS
jgi:hypothetical protein